MHGVGGYSDPARAMEPTTCQMDLPSLAAALAAGRAAALRSQGLRDRAEHLRRAASGRVGAARCWREVLPTDGHYYDDVVLTARQSRPRKGAAHLRRGWIRGRCWRALRPMTGATSRCGLRPVDRDRAAGARASRPRCNWSSLRYHYLLDDPNWARVCGRISTRRRCLRCRDELGGDWRRVGAWRSSQARR